jgi:hypothetical protein
MSSSEPAAPRVSLAPRNRSEPALQVLEGQLEIALAAPHPAHLVERHGSGGLARRDPRQPQHALERAERGLEVADQLVDRGEVVPQLDPHAEVVAADAGQGAVEQLDGALVGVRRARVLGGPAIPRRGFAPVAGQREVAGDLFLRRRAQALGVELEPARDHPVEGGGALVEAL